MPQKIGSWIVLDSGVRTAATQMAIDRGALESITAGVHNAPVVRFFQWDEPVVTYGYLLDPERVRQFAKENGGLPVVQRPTGGGAVVHTPTDLSVSLLWPKGAGHLPEKPRDCYEEIHAALRDGVRAYLGEGVLELFARTSNGCTTDPAVGLARFSVCFEQPVCNDVMLGRRKVVGGALRLTRRAILYQGAVQLRRTVNFPKLKFCLLTALRERILLRAGRPPAEAAAGAR
jgi:lipoate-protein ligase A